MWRKLFETAAIHFELLWGALVMAGGFIWLVPDLVRGRLLCIWKWGRP